ncbi:hypothetical protein Thiowin_00093 [Thiorhodovibrio winogradskyi]|uniref:Uncharacterized protein n=1 Tax=Thiorhodovibrio winogradskyi TaxID=77007 RepID=A0ABZ0S3K2_9GAMM|nr:hypothetical protein [Thiorhodovibrio winogradskyi]
MPSPAPSSAPSARASAAGRRDGSVRPTALTQGNHALRDGDPAQAIRHYALGLVDEPSHQNGPIAAQLAANLVRARRRYRQARWPAAASGAPLQVAVVCWSLSENPPVAPIPWPVSTSIWLSSAPPSPKPIPAPAAHAQPALRAALPGKTGSEHLLLSVDNPLKWPEFGTG